MTADELERSRPRTEGSEVTGPVADKVAHLVPAAAALQLGYAMEGLTAAQANGAVGPQASLINIVRAARDHLAAGDDPLTVLVRRATAGSLDDDAKKAVTRALAGGRLVEVSWPPLADHAVVLKHKHHPWHTASDLAAGWALAPVTNAARITLVSRLLLDLPERWPRYCAPIALDQEPQTGTPPIATAGDGSPGPPG